MNGVAVTPLTVDFHEGGFRSKLNSESKAPFWFQMDNDAKRQHGSPMGPANPQALNRYSYVQNNPLKYTDPTGHAATSCRGEFDCTVVFTNEETNIIAQALLAGASAYALYAIIAAMPGVTLPQAAIVALVAAILGLAGSVLALVAATGGHLEMYCRGISEWIGGCIPYFSWDKNAKNAGLPATASNIFQKSVSARQFTISQIQSPHQIKKPEYHIAQRMKGILQRE
jgi:hypothetical protein